MDPTIQQLLDLWPIGIIGIWRWISFLYRVRMSRKFREYHHEGELKYRTVGVRFTVKGEPHEHFSLVLQSLIDTGVDVIRVVFDTYERTNEAVILRFILENPRVDIDYRFTQQQGKRAGLKEAIYMDGNEEVTILIDSDTIFGLPDSELAPALLTVKEAVLAALSQENMGGVVVAQRVYQPKNWVQRLFDLMLTERYAYEVPGQAHNGYVSCLSGRCSAYPRHILLQIADRLTDEQWAGIEKTGGGEDKWLTTMVHDLGYRTTFTAQSTVYTRAQANYGELLQQTTRWMRNSWFSDLRALFTRRWMHRASYLRFFAIDRMAGAFTILLAPWFWFYAMATENWIGAFLIILWWCLSRSAKVWPYLKQVSWPERRIVFAYILSSMVMGASKQFALITIGERSWVGSRGGRQSTLANVGFFVLLLLIVAEGLLVFGPLTP